MRKISLLGSSALGSVAFIGLSLAAAPAYAQGAGATNDTPPCPTNGAATGTGTTTDNCLRGEVETQSGQNANPSDATQAGIVVTGSRIRRPNLESTVPVTSIGGEQFFERGNTNIGDALNDLPQLRSTFAQQNPGLGVGIAGLNLLDLRGLGTSRTLVLVNGRRHVAADILNNAVSPDINSIPNDLVERVDIVTGSQSAIYGSDAIAGVVNFILRRDFDGVQVRGQVGVTGQGFGGNQYVSAMAGHNFMDGRGNITIHGEYSNQERVFGSQIPWYQSANALSVVDVDPAGLPNGSDGYPDRVFIRDIRSASINRYGLVPITQRPSQNQCGLGIGSTNGAPGTTGGTAYNCTFLFTQNGQLIPQTGARFGQGIIGGIAGGNGQTGREEHLLSVYPFQKRYGANLLAHFTVSDAFEPFIEAKWNRVNTIGSNAGPSFIQGTLTQFDTRERIRLDNPFLTPDERTFIANSISASNCNTSLTVACPEQTNIGTTAAPVFIPGNLTPAQRAQIAAGTYRFVLARQLADSGIRDEKFQRDTVRFVGGFRGTFNDDWSYEVSGNYGKFKEDTTTYGYLDRQKFLLSLDAGRNPVTGQIQCRAQFDPASAIPFAGSDARLAADIAACVPYNPFGAADNSAAAKYFTYNARHKASLEQLDFLGFVNGDLSQLFELPGGPISFAVGAEYRRERARYKNDPYVESGATNAVVIGEFDPPTFKVKEAFAEVRVPILKDTPFFHELSLNGAGRVSDYGGKIGTVWTYNFGGEWAPVSDLRFRANYGKAVRAPNVSETGFPAVPNFAPGFNDPCSAGNIGTGSGSRAANCLTALGATLLAGLPNVSYSLPIISGSNPLLQPETSKSLTLGAVLQPRFLPGFSLSVDYYDIKVKGVIVSLSAQTIANNCYDQPTLDNVFCGLFQRYTGSTPGLLGTLPGQILANSLISAGVNFAKRERKGIDFNAAYRTKLSEDVRLDTNLIYVHGLKSSNFENPALPNFENRILGELGDPVDEFRFDADLTYREFTFGYRLHYIGKMWVNAYEDFNALPSACTSTCPPLNADFSDIPQYPKVFYHDFRIAWNLKNLGGIGKDYQFYVGVDNAFDRHPPLGTTGTGSGSAIYDIRGRSFYGGFRARF